jgi:hypothetical protein
MPQLASDVQAFEARATDADLDDLRARLAAARLPEAETVHRAAPGPRRWDQGVPLADLVEVVDYWRTGYDWRSFEERLNRIGQFRTTIDDLGIHFLHRRSTRADATALLLTHGWPGSIAEFIDVVDELQTRKTWTRRRSTSWFRRSRASVTATSRPPPGGEPKRSRPPGWN